MVVSLAKLFPVQNQKPAGRQDGSAGNAVLPKVGIVAEKPAAQGHGSGGRIENLNGVFQRENAVAEDFVDFGVRQRQVITLSLRWRGRKTHNVRRAIRQTALGNINVLQAEIDGID